jgi:hypothetical protein
MKRFPNSVDDLIRELDEQYPEVIAKPGDDPQQVFQAQLQRAVVLQLKHWRANSLKLPSTEQPTTRGKGRDVRR